MNSKRKKTKENNTKNLNKIEQKANEYGKAIISTLIVILMVVVAIFTIQNKNDKIVKEKYEATQDEIKFKKEYEGFNSTSNKVDIIEDNNIEYISLDKASEIINNGTGFIYFGYASNTMCRIAVPILLNAMESSDLETIYYVDLKNGDESIDRRDTFELTTKNKAKKVKDAESESYYNILTNLASYLNDYTLQAGDGTNIPTGEKRLLAPTVVAVKDGVIVDVVAKDESITKLSSKESNELAEAYSLLISNYLSDSCGLEQDTGC